MNGLKNLLEEQYLLRKAKNPKFSLRSFAKTLKIAPGRLSEYMRGKRRASPKTVLALGSKLGLSPQQRLRLLGTHAYFKDENSRLVEKTQISEDQFRFIVDWEHTALLSLLECNHIKKNEKFLARRLGIDVIVCRNALDRLERLKLIKRNSDSSFSLLKTQGSECTEDIPSDSLRKYHKQLLTLAEKSLELVSLKNRDISSVTLAINPKKLPEAKKLIRSFRYEMEALLESKPQTEVYALNIQLFPLTVLDLKEDI